MNKKKSYQEHYIFLTWNFIEANFREYQANFREYSYLDL